MTTCLHRPRVDSGGQLRRQTGDARGIEDVRTKTEAALDLLAPLFPQSGRGDHQRAPFGPPGERLGNHQAGLHGLAQTDGVRDQESAPLAAHERQHRLELKRHDAQARRRGRSKGRQ